MLFRSAVVVACAVMAAGLMPDPTFLPMKYVAMSVSCQERGPAEASPLFHQAPQQMMSTTSVPLAGSAAVPTVAITVSSALNAPA